MIYFVTNNKEYYTKSINKSIFPDIIILDENEGKNIYYQYFSKRKILAFDIEANGLDAYLLTPILYGFGTKSKQIMFDWTINIEYIFNNLIKYNTILLGHNLKYDIKIVKVQYNILFTKLYDTMIADQRLFMGLGYNFSYSEVVKRHLNKVILKTTRDEFIGADITKFKITASHLYYLKGDLVDLFDVRKVQQKLIKKYQVPFLIYGIEFPLINIIAKAELEGFVFDTELWRKRIIKEKQELFNIKVELDNEVRKLKEFKINFNNDFKIDIKVSLGGQKFNKERKPSELDSFINSDGTVNQKDLFGDPMTSKSFSGLKKKLTVETGNINYKSKKDIVHIFAALQEPMIKPDETFAIPQFDNKGKLIGKVDAYSIKADLLQRYLILKPDCLMKDFIKLLIKHSKLEKSLSTYGENFINKINPVTNKIHTIFRQCEAVTGRYQSGGGDNEPDKYNAQNIPRSNEYRNCFTVDAEKYSLVTADYSGAELIVMASHAQDFRLIELSEQDMHSHMATNCWRNIYYYRAKKLLEFFTVNSKGVTDKLKDQYREYVRLTKEYLVTKSLGDIRNAFKPMTFGVIYGMYPKKAGNTLNIPTEEGKIVIQTIESEIPNTIKMVKEASAFAKKNGFVIFDSRTNARAWFPSLIKLLKKEINEKDNFIEISEALSAARNKRIQGTQATFLKEAAVVLNKYFIKNKIDANQLAWVHDEFVIRITKELDGYSDEYILFNSLGNQINHPFSKGEKLDNLPQVIKIVLEEVANRYLNNVKIKVELETKPYWLK
jgi:DNA polymerase I-like protein with 3'-5' exonuclease and polymerase domains